MIIAINYADDKFKKTQKFNSRQAKKYGADKVIEYGPQNIDEEFARKNSSILSEKRGAGYWLWMPYIVLKTMDCAKDNDYIVYTDSGSAFVQPIEYLIRTMEENHVEIMAFCNNTMERMYSKRDALILMDMDRDEYLDTNQACGGYVVIKNKRNVRKVFEKYLSYACDRRIITDDENVMGYSNYPEFIDNRHNQTIWSLLCKKENIPFFRDPSQFGFERKGIYFSEEILKRSTYPQVIESHRNPNLKYKFQLDYYNSFGNRLLKRMYKLIMFVHDYFQQKRLSL